MILSGQTTVAPPTEQGRMLHRALQSNSVETKMIICKGEGLGLSNREHHLDSLRRVKEWFDEHLAVQ